MRSIVAIRTHSWSADAARLGAQPRIALTRASGRASDLLKAARQAGAGETMAPRLRSDEAFFSGSVLSADARCTSGALEDVAACGFEGALVAPGPDQLSHPVRKRGSRIRALAGRILENQGSLAREARQIAPPSRARLDRGAAAVARLRQYPGIIKDDECRRQAALETSRAAASVA